VANLFEKNPVFRKKIKLDMLSQTLHAKCFSAKPPELQIYPAYSCSYTPTPYGGRWAAEYV